MKVVDSSVVVAALIDWHPHHDIALRVLGKKPRIVAHALIESYSVLTRLPAPLATGAIAQMLSLPAAFAAFALVLAVTAVAAGAFASVRRPVRSPRKA